MNRGWLQHTPPLTKLMFSVFIVFSVFLFFSLTGSLLAVPIFNMELRDIYVALTNFSDPYTGLLKYMQIIQSIGLFLLPPFIIAWGLHHNSLTFLRARTFPSLFTGLLVAVIMFTAIPFINLLASLNAGIELPEQFGGLERWMKQTEENAQKITELFLQQNAGMNFVVNMLMIAIIPAIGEEFLFRGVLQRLFSEWTNNKHMGILIGAILFSAFHFQFYGFIPRMLLGGLFGYLLIWSGSIWLPVLAHFVNNSMAVVFYYFYSVEEVKKQIDTIGATQETYVLAVISGILVSFGLWLVYRWEKRTKNASPKTYS